MPPVATAATPPDPARKRAALAQLLQATVLDNEYIPHAPTPKQARFLLAMEREVFYGGAVGGGKSDALLMAALQYVHVPGYAALLLRRNFSDLSQPGALMPRLAEWLEGTDARWVERDKTWHFPSGATITFGYMMRDPDRFRYRSAEYQFIGWDELTDFSEVQYTYLMSRLRRLATSPVPIRMRSASNPDGPGAEWVGERFIPYDADRKPRPLPPGRRFVAAGLDDNPHLDTAEYELSLMALDAVTRAQLRDGDWTVRHLGGMLDRTMLPIIEQRPDGLTLVRYWDVAATEPSRENPDPDWTVGALLGTRPGDPMTYLCDVVRFRGNPGRVSQVLAATAQMDGYDVRIGMEQEPGSSGKQAIHTYATTVFRGYAFTPYPATGSKVVRAQPWAAAAANDTMRLVRGEWNRPFIVEAEAFPDGSHDDQIDATSGGFNMLHRAAPRGSRL